MAQDQRNVLAYNPPSFFWIATYLDGTLLSQFNAVDGHEHLFKEIVHSRLLKFGWYPFSLKLATLVSRAGTAVYVNPALKPVELELKEGQKLIAFMRQIIHSGSVKHCCRCGCVWQFRDKPSQLGVMHSDKAHEAVGIDGDGKQKTWRSSICPGCGSYNKYLCPVCLIPRSKRHGEVGFQYFCNQCKRDLPIDWITEEWIERRETVYVLGYQQGDIENLHEIDEFGNVT